MHYFSTLFGKELYMFKTDLLSIIRSLNIVFTATGISHTSYVAACWRGQDGTSLAGGNITRYVNKRFYYNSSILTLLADSQHN